MIAWIVLLVLLVAEGGGLAWWLRKEYYHFIFNSWAPLIYSTVLAIDFIITRIVSVLVTPGGSTLAAILAIIGVILFILVGFFTFFFRWVIRFDFNEPPK